MIVILTRSPNIFSAEWIKYTLRKLLMIKRGPDAVLASLCRGLNELSINFKINPPKKDIQGVVHVLSGLKGLKYCISNKTKLNITKIIAGPNVVIHPSESDNIIKESHIDTILQPSIWVKKLFEHNSPSLSSKIKVWPAGVKDPYVYKDMPIKNDFFIVFQKNSNKEMFEFIINTLESKKINYKIIEYGKFKQIDYLRLLEQSKAMIYLSKSESQGIALQEAWIRNTPTLVWDRGFWEYNVIKFEHEKISCPYLTEESGMTFKGVGDFTQKLDEFLGKTETFSARNYCIKNLTDKITAQIYIDIINSNEKFD